MRHAFTMSVLAAFTVVMVAVVAVAAAAPAAVVAFVGPDPAVSPGYAAAEAPDRTAVVDRLGDDRAVLLLDGDGARTPERRVVDPAAIPERGRHEGAVLDATDEGYVYNRTATKIRERDLSRWFDALSGRSREPGDTAGSGPTNETTHSRPGTAALGVTVV